jgi:flavin reductase (DIM6/NTAB) family NADH-FMN oxidoreductase RutF
VTKPEVLHIRPEDEDPKDIYKMMIGLVVPRPIAFVSTVDAAGNRNLAPFSFYNGVCAAPPVLCFSAAMRSGAKAGLRPQKDTLNNVRETGEFVVNVVSEEIAAAMNATAAEVGPEVDEFALAGLTAVASEVVRAPRVAEAKAQMECKLLQIVTVSDRPGGASLVIGEIVRFHVQAGVFEKFHIDPDRLGAVGRMAGATYVRTRDRFDLERPKNEREARESVAHSEEGQKR